MYSHLDPDDYNYRILVGSTEDLIRDTVCSKDFGVSSKNANNPRISFVDTNGFIPEMKKDGEQHQNGAGISGISETFGSLIVTTIFLIIFLS